MGEKQGEIGCGDAGGRRRLRDAVQEEEVEMRRFAAALVALSAGLLLNAVSAGATFPGQNGKIVFVREEPGPLSTLVTIDPDGQNQTPLISSPVHDFVPGASYSADGERIVFSRFLTGDSEIFEMGADGQSPTQLTDNPVEDSHPAFSPDGNKVVFASRPDGGDLEIVVMDSDGQNQVPLTNNGVNDLDPSFSPDGQKIVFTRPVGTDGEIFLMDPDGANQQPLTDDTEEAITPSFSPDGQRIVFGQGAGASREIAVIDADGQNLVPLTSNTTNDLYPSFSPDGNKIAFTSFDAGDGGINLMEADGQNQVVLTDTPGIEFWTNWQPLNPPSCDLTGEPKQKSFKAVSVTATCANENASVVAQGAGTAKVPARAVASKSKKFTIPPVTASVPAGTPTTIELPIPRKGKKALKKAAKAGKKGKATVTMTATDDFGESTQDSLAVKFKKKKKK
jgi:Tol biopolymer transport system component